MNTPLDFNFEKGMNISKTNKSVFHVRELPKSSIWAFSLLLSCLPSTTHNLYYWKEQFNVPYRDGALLISLQVFCLDETRIPVTMVFFIYFKFNRMKVMCFFLLVCTVNLIKFELKLNLISFCNAFEDHSMNSHTIFVLY